MSPLDWALALVVKGRTKQDKAKQSKRQMPKNKRPLLLQSAACRSTDISYTSTPPANPDPPSISIDSNQTSRISAPHAPENLPIQISSPPPPGTI